MALLYFILAAVTISISWEAAKKQTWSAPGRIFIFGIFTYGLLLKPFAVYLEYPSKEIIESILYPITISNYWRDSLWLLSLYLMFSISLLLVSSVYIKPNQTKPTQKKIKFSIIMCTIYATIGLVALFMFFQKNSTLLNSGSKNALATTDIADYSGDGLYRLVITILFIVPFFLMANINSNYYIKISKRIAIITAITYIAYAYLSDQRGIIIFSIISWAIAYSRLINKITKKQIFIALTLILISISIKTTNRLSNESLSPAEASANFVSNFIGKNFIENSKTLAVIEITSSQTDYDLGKSYIEAFTILIPRSFVPDKQTVNLDTKIGEKIYNCNLIGACAVPPGLLAESYFNFGVIWMFISVFIAGLISGIIDAKYYYGDVKYTLFYSINLVYFGISLLGSGLSSYITTTIIQLIIFWGIWYSAKLKPSHYSRYKKSRDTI